MRGKVINLSNPYIPNDTYEIKQRLLESIGLQSVEDVFEDIPKNIPRIRNLTLPKGKSEVEVRREVEQILNKNTTIRDHSSFLGGGVWNHYVPSVVDTIVSRGEFLTSYTPYQPEISQGILQVLFEYQSMMAELLEIDIVNSSMYDWASSLGEAVRMATRVTRRREVFVPHFISPNRLNTLKSYTNPVGIRVREIDQSLHNGQINFEELKEKVSSQTAAIYVENPSYLGFIIHRLRDLSEIAHECGSLFIVGVDPTSLGVLKPPGTYGADIVIGEGQPLGNYMNYGGPLLGIFACRNNPKLIRQLPGRIVGMTTTNDETERGYCMVLQTREQHIRREKATSNICTNHTLCAVRAAIYMALLGREGFKHLGEYLFAVTQYAKKRLSMIKSIEIPFLNTCHFKDFTVTFDGLKKRGVKINDYLLKCGIIGGKPLRQDFPELGNTFLYSITEIHTQADIDVLVTSVMRMMEVLV
jgi:glycine dehydrogenase subunit 1